MSNKKNVTIAASRSLCLYPLYHMSGVDFNSNFLNLQYFLKMKGEIIMAIELNIL